MLAWFAANAWLPQGWAQNARCEIEAQGRIARINVGANSDGRDGCERIDGMPSNARLPVWPSEAKVTTKATISGRGANLCTALWHVFRLNRSGTSLHSFMWNFSRAAIPASASFNTCIGI